MTREFPKSSSNKSLVKQYDEVYKDCIEKGQTEFLAHITAKSGLLKKYGSVRVEKALASGYLLK